MRRPRRQPSRCERDLRASPLAATRASTPRASPGQAASSSAAAQWQRRHLGEEVARPGQRLVDLPRAIGRLAECLKGRKCDVRSCTDCSGRAVKRFTGQGRRHYARSRSRVSGGIDEHHPVDRLAVASSSGRADRHPRRDARPRRAEAVETPASRAASRACRSTHLHLRRETTRRLADSARPSRRRRPHGTRRRRAQPRVGRRGRVAAGSAAETESRPKPSSLRSSRPS